MVNVALTITTKEEVGVLDEITKVISAFGFNISYANLYVGIDTGVLNIENQGHLCIRFQYFLCKPLCGLGYWCFKHRA